MPASRYNKLFLVILLTGILACKKDKGPFLSTTPHISLVEMQPDSVKQFEEKILIVIEYTDGDGNIGFDHPDSVSLLIRDRRITEADSMHVQPISPPGSEITVKGTLSISLSSTFLIGNGDKEITSYEIRLRDRDNHWSNTITTPEIIIYK
jgi:hypothetical protein